MGHWVNPGVSGGLLVPLLLTTGCGVSDRGPELALAYDSAGVAVLVVSGDRVQGNDGWSIGSSPIWRAGDREREAGHQLHEVMGATRFLDGRVAVANAGSNELRFFNARAEFDFRSGGAGSGPGEFASLRAVHRTSGDSLVAVDLGLRRVSVFDERGAFARSFNIPHLETGTLLELVGELGDGWFLYRSLPIMGAAPIERGTFRLPMTLYRTDRDGENIRELGRFPGFEVLVTPMDGRPSISGLLTFGRNAVVAPAPSGFVLGLAEAYEVTLHDVHGSIRQVLRRDVGPRAVLAEHVEARRLDIRQGMPDSPIRDVFEQRLDAAPATFPPYESMLVDKEGILWVGRYMAPGDETRVWDLFQLERGLVSTLDVPAKLSILEVGTDYILGLSTDEFGVEVVEVYDLKRGN